MHSPAEHGCTLTGPSPAWWCQSPALTVRLLFLLVLYPFLPPVLTLLFGSYQLRIFMSSWRIDAFLIL